MADLKDLPAASAPGLGSVAVVGLAGRFPGAGDVRALWQLLRDGREAVRWLDADTLRAAGASEEDLADPNYVRASLPLDDMPCFDASFFGINPRDAAVMDPQHRHFIECCWEAMEDAGHGPGCFEGAVGVFGGCGPQAYFARHLLPHAALMRSMGEFLVRHTGNDKDFLTTRVSYLLDLRGPSVGVQTACSTSLVAVHLAAQSLLAGECDLALAGGASIELPHGLGYRHVAGEILSPDGRCRAFDADATGTLFGSGVGVVALRRLDDALRDGDPVWAVIRGSAINNDGRGKVGYLAPSVDGQARVAAEALAVSGLQPQDIDYIEAHGTGTAIGDPIEVTALSQAYGAAAIGSIGLGSVKTNIGHLDTAAGVTSLIKVCLALRHGYLPASLHFRRLHPQLQAQRLPLRVQAQGQSWGRGSRVRRAAVHALGVGGTNAHVVLEEPPARPAPVTPFSPLKANTPDWQLVPLSARSPQALRALVERWRRWETPSPDPCSLADVAYTAQVGRAPMPYRLALVAQDWGGLRERLAEAAQVLDADPSDQAPAALSAGWACARAAQASEQTAIPVTFMFPGAGSMAPGVGQALLVLPAFVQAVERCQQALPVQAPASLRASLAQWPADPAWMTAPATALPALFILEYALASLWQTVGIEPQAVMGHSAGEVAAACVAGLLTLEEGMALACARGRLLGEVGGGMLSVDAPAEVVQRLLEAAPAADGQRADSEPAASSAYARGLDLAAFNAPDLCLVSGDPSGLRALSERLHAQGIDSYPVHAAVAAHSRGVEPLLSPLQALCEGWPLRPARLPFLSLVEARWIQPGETLPPGYWLRHMRQPVRCCQAFARLLQDQPQGVLLECGPGQAMASLARANGSGTRWVLGSSAHPRDLAKELPTWLASAGALWARGLPVRLTDLRGPAPRQRVSLPTYPFERQRHWVDPPALAQTPPGSSAASAPAPAATHAPAGTPRAPPKRLAALRDWFLAEEWVAAPPASQEVSTPSGAWLLLGQRSPTAQALAYALARQGVEVLGVDLRTERPGDSAQGTDAVGGWTLGELPQLLARYQSQGRVPRVVVHLGALEAPADASPQVACACAFDSAVALARAWLACDVSVPARWLFVTAGGLPVGAERPVAPAQALALGPARVIPAELEGVQATLLDLDPSTAADDCAVRALIDEARWQVHSQAYPQAEAHAHPHAPSDPVVAWRAGQRLIPRQRPAYPASTDSGPTASGAAPLGTSSILQTHRPDSPLRLRRGGVYLITGGLGDVGLALAAWLARTCAPRLALISRRELPPPEQWPALAARPHDPQAALLGQLLAIQGAGAELQVFAADAADLPSMSRVLGACALRWGAVHGVFHAAGVLEDAPLATKSVAAMHQLMSGKAQGAWVLDRLLPAPLDVFAVFSSTSVLLGPAGQADYVAANAYLEALAAARSDGHVMRWGLWSNIGVAARQAGLALPGPPAACVSPPSVHPLLGLQIENAPPGLQFEARIEPAQLWLLQEHQVAGRPVVPGVAYLEMARAAVATLRPGVPLALRALVLESALVFDTAPRQVRTTLQPAQEGGSLAWTCQIDSRGPGEPAWTCHARLEVAVSTADALRAGPDGQALPESLDLPTLGSDAWRAATAPQADHPLLALGPRWDLLHAITDSARHLAGHLALSPGHATDLSVWAWHPALLDIGLTLGLHGPRAGPQSLYVPVSMDSACLPARLPRTLVCVCTRRQALAAGALALDVYLRSATGEPLGWVRGLLMQPVDARRLHATAAPDEHALAPLQRLLEGGIPGELAGAVFDRWLRHPARCLTISSMDLPALHGWMHGAVTRGPGTLAMLQPAAGASASSWASSGGSSDRSPPPEGLTPTEATIAALWCDLLGVRAVQPGDDFFALGGHSLLAVRLVARLRRQLDADLPLSVLLEAPTLRQLADRVHAAASKTTVPNPGPAPGSVPVFEPSPAPQPAPTPAPTPHAAPAVPMHPAPWSPLVAIQRGEPGRRPLFCVHGAGGNVLNFRLLADRIGPAVPFFGLQAQGVDGRLAPLDTIEAMASQYLDALQAACPQGPYRLAGYSAGGVIALEMAHRLQTQGQRVELLAMIDTLHPQAAAERLPWWRRAWLMRTWSLGFALRWPERRRRGRLVQTRYAQALAQRARGQALPLEWVEFHLFCNFLKVQARYQVPSWPGDLLLFRARDAEVPYLAAGPTLGWNRSVQGRIDVIALHGSHFSVMSDPGLGELAQGLRQTLARLDG